MLNLLCIVSFYSSSKEKLDYSGEFECEINKNWLAFAFSLLFTGNFSFHYLKVINLQICKKYYH